MEKFLLLSFCLCSFSLFAHESFRNPRIFKTSKTSSSPMIGSYYATEECESNALKKEEVFGRNAWYQKCNPDNQVACHQCYANVIWIDESTNFQIKKIAPVSVDDDCHHSWVFVGYCYLQNE